MPIAPPEIRRQIATQWPGGFRPRKVTTTAPAAYRPCGDGGFCSIEARHTEIRSPGSLHHPPHTPRPQGRTGCSGSFQEQARTGLGIALHWIGLVLAWTGLECNLMEMCCLMVSDDETGPRLADQDQAT